jgi:4-oxalocrotonate tautomerase
MPIANIQILQGREPAMKAALIKSVTAAIVETLHVPAQSVRVIVQEVDPAHWGIGGVSAKELGR